MAFHFPSLLFDLGLLFMRLVVALVFGASGWYDVTDTVHRAQSIGMSEGFTLFLGLAEIAGGIGLALGILVQAAALGLILISLGAIQKKIFAWGSGFWGEKSSGWHYDLLLIAMNSVILFSDGGRLRIL